MGDGEGQNQKKNFDKIDEIAETLWTPLLKPVGASGTSERSGSSIPVLGQDFEPLYDDFD